jgi:hypothetical protein
MSVSNTTKRVKEIRRCLVQHHAGAVALESGDNFPVCRVGLEILQWHVGTWR